MTAGHRPIPDEISTETGVSVPAGHGGGLPHAGHEPAQGATHEPLASESTDAVAALSLGTAGFASERYVLDRELAQGGMGRIFIGRDRRLNRQVAIKMLRHTDEQALARFEREVRLSARLQHPGIVPIYDSGFWPTGEPFLVMKRVLGRSLSAAILEAESIEERMELLPVIARIAEALAYAHDQGIVHRDLKPGNVLLGAFGEVVIIDWGLAKHVDEAPLGLGATSSAKMRAVEASAGANPRPTPDIGITVRGQILGTPGYMAPEQAAGGTADKRADVFALGGLIYQVLSGSAPNMPPSNVQQTVREKVPGLPSVPPVRPASSSATEPSPVVAPLVQLEPWVPVDLLAIIEKAMAHDPATRYPSAFEFREDLERFLAGRLVAAHRYSNTALLRRFVARHPLALLALLLALGYWLWR